MRREDIALPEKTSAKKELTQSLIQDMKTLIWDMDNLRNDFMGKIEDLERLLKDG